MNVTQGGVIKHIHTCKCSKYSWRGGGGGGEAVGLSSNAKLPGLVKGKQQHGARCEAQ